MTVKDLQKNVVDALNGVEALVQGGCKAFAEDSRTVYDEAVKWTHNGGVSLVVVTPEMTRNGCTAGAIPAAARLQVQCSEAPAVSRVRSGVMTALDAAETAMHALDGRDLCWEETRQSFDRQSGVLTATATFAVSVLLTPLKL